MLGSRIREKERAKKVGCDESLHKDAEFRENAAASHNALCERAIEPNAVAGQSRFSTQIRSGVGQAKWVGGPSCVNEPLPRGVLCDKHYAEISYYVGVRR